MPFTIDYFGGWDKAYPDVIEKVFRDQVRRRGNERIRSMLRSANCRLMLIERHVHLS